jgi:hypothetical protein
MARRTPGRPLHDSDYHAQRVVDHAKCMRALKRLEILLPFAFITGEARQAVNAGLGAQDIRRALESVDPSPRKKTA